MTESSCRSWLLVLLMAASAGLATAQTAQTAPPPPARESKEAREAREAAEAMERARRLAANPMRVILEASRVRRRADGDPAAQVVPVAGGTTVAAGPVSVAGATEPVARALPPGREATPSAAPASAQAEPSTVLNSDLLRARAAAEAAPALDARAMPKPLEAPVVALPSLTALAPEIARPTLVSRVDPDVPPRLLSEIEPNTVVAADLTIRPDGSVAQVAIVQSNAQTQRALMRFVVAALQQWRFAPLPGERLWRVELLFRPE